MTDNHDTDAAFAPTVTVAEPDLIANKGLEKAPIVVTQVAVEKKPSLAITMARQNSEIYTEPDWPDLMALPKNITYILRRGGLYEVRKNSVGTFVVKRENFAVPLPGFPKDDPSEGFMMNHGKIPYELFQETLSFFKSICDESKDEVYVQTFWDPEAKVHFNHVPKQIVSGTSVKFDRDIELEKRCVLVLETHSHNTMGAFFSGTDNADEKADRFFGVIGELNKSIPAFLYSFVCGGKRVTVDPTNIFQNVPTRDFSDWKSRVTRGSANIYQYSAAAVNYGGRYQGGHMGGDSWPDDEPNERHSQSNHWQGKNPNSYSYQSHGSESQPAFWRGESPSKSQSEREKEAYKEVEEATKEIRSQINTPQLSSNKQDKSKKSDPQEWEVINAMINAGITLFQMQGDTMSDIEKEAALGRLIAALSDDNIAILAKVMVECGHTPEMLSALEIDMVVNDDDDAQVQMIG